MDARGPGLEAPEVKSVAPAIENIETIAALERKALEHRTAMDCLTDAITAAAGSPAFVVAHLILFSGWLTLNIFRDPPFDPYPFSLLTLFVALEAIILTSFVLMTQKRMTRQADKRAHLDLQVNMLSEQELTAILRMVSALCEHSGVAVPAPDSRAHQLGKETDIHEIAEAVDRKLVGSASTDF